MKMVEYSLLGINILAAVWVLVGYITARVIHRKEIKMGIESMKEVNK